METHQRRKSTRRRRGRRRMVEEKRRETHRFPAQLGSHGRLGRRPVVALVKEKVERTLHGRKAHGQVTLPGNIEQPLRSCHYFLRSEEHTSELQSRLHLVC